MSAAEAASLGIERYLRYENANGADIYISMNTLKPEAKGRTKADIAAVRHLYPDLDQDGDARLQQIRETPSLPKPSYVLDTSPGKHQVIWKVEGLTVEQASKLCGRWRGSSAATPRPPMPPACCACRGSTTRSSRHRSGSRDTG